MISQHWADTDSRTSSPWKTGVFLYFTVNTADGMAKQEAWSSAVMAFTWFAWNISV